MPDIVQRRKRFVQRIARAGGVSSGFAVLTGQVVAGILERKSVHLSEIGRALKEDVPLIETERRLSSEMANRKYDDEALRRGYLKTVAKTLTRCRYIIGDTTDLAKPYGKEFEYLDIVRDASSKDKHLEPGYWAVQMEATTDDHKNVPVDLQVFSTKAPDYAGWYETLEASFERVMPYLPMGATWLLDRGFDDIKVMALLNRYPRPWVIRQKQNRNIIVADMPREMAEFVEHMSTPYETWVPYVDSRTHKEATGTVRYNFAHIGLPTLDGTYTLIVVDHGRKDPMVLLARGRVTRTKAIEELIRAYLRRWACEEGLRLLKQKANLEDFRVRNYTSIQRLALMAMIAYGTLASLVHHAPKVVQDLLSRRKDFIEVVLYPYYRLWDAAAASISDSG